MFNNGVIDIHDAANVCGGVYDPSFVEIENKASLLHYFNGAIFGGGGIFLESKAGGVQAIRFDPNTINELGTMANKGKRLTTTGSAIER